MSYQRHGNLLELKVHNIDLHFVVYFVPIFQISCIFLSLMLNNTNFHIFKQGKRQVFFFKLYFPCVPARLTVVKESIISILIGFALQK